MRLQTDQLNKKVNQTNKKELDILKNIVQWEQNICKFPIKENQEHLY